MLERKQVQKGIGLRGVRTRANVGFPFFVSRSVLLASGNVGEWQELQPMLHIIGWDIYSL